MIRRYQKGSVRKKNGNYVLRYREDFIKHDGTEPRAGSSALPSLGPSPRFTERTTFVAQLMGSSVRSTETVLRCRQASL